MPEMRTIDTGEVALRCAVEGEGPLVIMVHGFPESWYSWRHQIGPVADAGFTACAVDVRGYGGSDKPQPVEAYAMERIVGDLIGLRKALSPDAPAVLVGHDWGAPIVWNSALTHPEHFRAVAGMSVPFSGVPQRPFTEVFREHFTSQGRFFYQEYFQEPGVAEAEAEADPRDFVQRMMYSISGDVPPGDYWDKPLGATFLEGLPDPEPVAWLTEDDLDFYEAEFTASGFRGPLNRYRNHEADYEWLQNWAGKRIEQPALFIGGTRDPATFLFGAIEDPVALVKMFAPRAEGHILDGVGHWTQQERPDEVNAVLIDWLKRL
ncbi:MAG: alpha/beta hydrolase [Pseudomonadota bacterium]|jgi:pimeloyl-ACP methyl ester carboxylesterase|uniref:alpha/beta fold hydrolase n=1 Tax=Qipengyuania flava TaxID=192812 RepID=UPI0007F4A1A8|nr:alpha/beta hydrolase [Qipengyuania flava]MEC8713704.1 alpha/beta hydrolase [Pseudomonadota bacterium]OAN81539.1 epoxide hydrolase [Erythrobacter sp. EhN03]|tara:strand:+ start:183 stop:1142 length:960 start_codon:yes stop_codon:yes gene_type:complete